MALTHEEYYNAANITTNPFRSTPTSEADSRKGIWVGYQKERNTLLKILTRTRADQVGNVNFALVYGELGAGKSHALLWSQYQILVENKEEFNSVAFYIPTLKKDKGLMSFASAFKEDIVSRSNIVNDVMTFKQFLEERIIEFKRDNNIGPEVVREIVLKEILPSTDLFNLAKEILSCQDTNKIASLLSPKGDYEALLLFTRIVNLFVYEFQLPSGKQRFKKAVYLLIDEMDLLARCSAKEAREVNDLIRHMYDSCPDCFCLILAFTATVAALTILFAEYVLSRVSRQIVLDFLQPDEAKVFVKEILDTARIDASQNNGYYPFAEEAVDTIVSQIVSITPRKIVNMMQQIIEEVRLAGINPEDGLVTSQMLDDKEIWDEVM